MRGKVRPSARGISDDSGAQQHPPKQTRRTRYSNSQARYSPTAKSAEPPTGLPPLAAHGPSSREALRPRLDQGANSRLCSANQLKSAAGDLGSEPLLRRSGHGTSIEKPPCSESCVGSSLVKENQQSVSSLTPKRRLHESAQSKASSSSQDKRKLRKTLGFDKGAKHRPSKEDGEATFRDIQLRTRLRAAGMSADDNDAPRRNASARAGHATDGTEIEAAENDAGLQSLLRKLGSGLEDFFPFGGLGASRTKAILQKLKSATEDYEKVDALSELCEVLAVGGMGVLSTFNVEAFVPSIVGLLSPPNSPDTMLLAAQALTHMMEVLPTASSSIATLGAIEPLCASLLTIEYIDLAEHSLIALEKLSIDYPIPIVKAGGFAAALLYVDFFSTPVQRIAAQLACNLSRNCPVEKFESVEGVLSTLLNLLSYEDQRIRESATVSFARLADSFKHKPEMIEILNGNEGALGKHMMQLVKTSYPPNLSSSAFSSALSLLGVLFRSSVSFSVQALRDEAFICALARLLDREKAHCGDALRLIDAMLPDAATASDEASAGVRTRRHRSLECLASSNPIDESRREAIANEMSCIELLGTVSFGGLVEVYTGSEASTQRDRVLSIIEKYVSVASADVIRALLKLACSAKRDGEFAAPPMNFVPFLALILKGNGSVTGRLRCLNISSTLLNKLPADVHASFQREGMIQDIKTLQTRVESSEEEKNSEGVALIKRKARALYSAHFEGITEENSSAFRTAAGVSRDLGSSDALVAQDALVQLALLLCSEDGLSTYELFESGLASSLYEFLTSSSSKQEQVDRLMAVFNAFMKFECTGSFEVLVRRLLVGLATEEHFAVVSSSLPQGASTVFEYGLRKLTQPLKLSIRRSSNETQKKPALRDFPASVVLIEPLATMGSIQDFLWPRVRVFGAAGDNAKPSRKFHSEDKNEKSSAVPSDAFCGGKGDECKTAEENENKGVDECESLQFPVDDAKRESVESSGTNSGLTENDEKQFSCDSEDEESDSSEDGDHEEEFFMDEDGDMYPGASVMSQVEDIDTGEGRTLASDALGTSLPAVELNFERNMGSSSLSSSPHFTGSVHRGDCGDNVALSASFGRGSYMAALKNQARFTSQKAESASTSPANLVFRLSGVQVPISHTILQAVAQQRARGPASDPISFRLWDVTHTLEYESIDSSSFSNDRTEEHSAEVPRKMSEVLRESGARNERWIDLYRGTHVQLPGTELPAYVSEKFARLLVLLKQLYWLNEHYSLLALNVERSAEAGEQNFVGSSTFQSQKLSAKISRQISDPLVLCGGLIPSWCFDVSRDYPFLLPFEVRLALFQSSSLGLAQALSRLQARSVTQTRASNGTERSRGNGEAQIGRIQRQKVRIHRDQILESAIRMMDMYASHRTVLEVEYFDEAGTGLGPTVEFYSNVCLELQRQKHALWRSDSTETTTSREGLVKPTGSGLFPACLPPPNKAKQRSRVLQLYRFLGQFCGKALLDGRLLDLRFSTEFGLMILSYARSVGGIQSGVLSSNGGPCELDVENMQIPEPELGETGLHILQDVDPVLARSLSLVLEMKSDTIALADLGLCFTLPGDEETLLEPGGNEKAVTAANVESYVRSVSHFVLHEGVKLQAQAFVKGFSSVLNITSLLTFTANELEVLFCGPEYENWDAAFLVKSTICDHGYSHSSPVIGYLFQFLSELNGEEERAFLRFITGTPRLPIGGLAALQPRLTIVKRTLDHGGKADDCLPTVMTCSNYLKLPEYSNYDVLRTRFMYAMSEGQGSFHLS
mmetsp:Transcript_10767/g.28795  ORF Transcript_10767/g.28795 Transcript_10767/m.28795 type:complete len:1777 (+) Transcript_10767:55-5385(+)